jgi:hypothetical protein
MTRAWSRQALIRSDAVAGLPATPLALGVALHLPAYVGHRRWFHRV